MLAAEANDTPVPHQWISSALRETYAPHLISSTARILAQHGYESMESLMRNKHSRAEWSEFAGRIGVPDAVATDLAAHWGPKLPDANMVMDRRERLAAELRAHYGADWDNARLFQSRHSIKFLMHDTWLDTSGKICRDGFITAQPANDAAYDGHLVFGQAPPVVFFQASHDGTDGSIYPRESLWQTHEKGRFLIPPRQLALHTRAFRMYFVQISDSREVKAGGDSKATTLQLHMLFISENHKSLDFCEQHFLLVNKKTFQPFRYDDNDQTWKSFDNSFQTGTEAAFMGRQVKVNVCVAQDVPIPFSMPSQPASRSPEHLAEVKWAVLEEHGGLIEAPSSFDGTRTRVKKLCNHFLQRGQCRNGDACTFDHKGGLLTALPSWCCAPVTRLDHPAESSPQASPDGTSAPEPIWGRAADSASSSSAPPPASEPPRSARVPSPGWTKTNRTTKDGKPLWEGPPCSKCSAPQRVPFQPLDSPGEFFEPRCRFCAPQS